MQSSFDAVAAIGSSETSAARIATTRCIFRTSARDAQSLAVHGVHGGDHTVRYPQVDPSDGPIDDRRQLLPLIIGEVSEHAIDRIALAIASDPDAKARKVPSEN